VKKLVALASELGTLDEQLTGKKAEQKEYRERLHELHAEVVTLKTVKSSGSLLASLEQKLREASDRVSKVTTEIVSLQEKSMVARIHLQDEIGELRLDDKLGDKESTSSKAASTK
jgi:flagellar biosynthesis chaperone FliJ